MLYNDIKSSYILARRYVERCCIEVEQDGRKIQAFTEHEGKMRVTDWGGTSSAIGLLHQTGTSGTLDMNQKLKNAANWLISDQALDGSWEAAEMQCCEATSAVIFDLFDTQFLTQEILNKAVKYIQNCYKSDVGAFTSQPCISQVPHIYTTYLAVRSLYTVNSATFSREQKEKIITWVNNVKATDGNWGSTVSALEGTVAHTVFALLILYYCGINQKMLIRNYKKQIKWLQSRIKHCSTISGSFSYEAIEVYGNHNKDSYGKKANILKSYHFNTALLCTFFLKINKIGISQRLIRKLITLRSQQDGWGLISENKIFVWATQQAIDCMYQFEKIVFKNGKNIFSCFRSFIYNIPYFGIKLPLVLALVPTTVWLLKDEQKGIDIILGIIFLIVPWLVKRED